MSFTVSEESQVWEVTCHCRKARLYRAHLSLFLNVLVVTVKSEMTDWGRLFHTKGDARQKARLEKLRTVGLVLLTIVPLPHAL